jgi:hypothetical protein
MTGTRRKGPEERGPGTTAPGASITSLDEGRFQTVPRIDEEAEEPRRTPGKAEGDGEPGPAESEPGRTPGQAEGERDS